MQKTLDKLAQAGLLDVRSLVELLESEKLDGLAVYRICAENNIKLPIAFVREYPQAIYWKVASCDTNMSKAFLIEFQDYLDWGIVAGMQLERISALFKGNSILKEQYKYEYVSGVYSYALGDVSSYVFILEQEVEHIADARLGGIPLTAYIKHEPI